MTTRTYTLNKRALSKEERENVSRNYRGLTALADTLTERVTDENGRLISGCTYYIYKGSWTPYGACVKHGDKYVFARYSRYDALSVDFTDFAIDCDEHGNDHDVFTTKHFTVNKTYAINKGKLTLVSSKVEY